LVSTRCIFIRRPIAYKYRKGTMKSTLLSSRRPTAYNSLYNVAPNNYSGSERESEIAYTYTQSTRILYKSALVQSDRVSYLLYQPPNMRISHIMARLIVRLGHYTRHNCTTRFETRTKEFNWITSRRVLYIHILTRHSESNLYYPVRGRVTPSAARAE